jgi:hypothetical protein
MTSLSVSPGVHPWFPPGALSTLRKAASPCVVSSAPMFFPKTPYLLSILLFAAWPLAAQVHEEAPVDLSKALIVEQATADKDTAVGSAEKTRVAQASFAASALVEIPTPASDLALLGQGDAKQGWRLFATADGALRFEGRTKDKADPITVATPAAVVAPGSIHHVAVNILRDPTKPNAGIWLDGVELTSGVVPPVNLSAASPFTAGVTAKHVRLYHRDLTRAEILALQLEALTDGKPKPRHPAPPPDGPRFIPQPNETIALIGGTEAVAVAESSQFEAMLLMAFPESRFRFRSLAWEGDTVFHQDRPLNFGDLAQQLRRVNADAVFVMFGRQECLDRGMEGLEDFKVAIGKLLDQVQKQTPNIVVIGPVPFEKMGAPMPDLTSRNQDLKSYNEALKNLADSRGLVFADVMRQVRLARFNDVTQHSTNDGVTLSSGGRIFMTAMVLQSLKKTKSGWAIDELAPTKGLYQAIAAKNRLWHDYWRPTNWAFLHGDRTQQPSSRDHVNPQVRFFPSEQEKYLPLIKEAEEKIYKLVDETTKKLP